MRAKAKALPAELLGGSRVTSGARGFAGPQPRCCRVPQTSPVRAPDPWAEAAGRRRLMKTEKEGGNHALHGKIIHGVGNNRPKEGRKEKKPRGSRTRLVSAGRRWEARSSSALRGALPPPGGHRPRSALQPPLPRGCAGWGGEEGAGSSSSGQPPSPPTIVPSSLWVRTF